MYAIKAEITDTKSVLFELSHQKTMYGGKRIAAGDTVFLFSSENEGGQGLFARGVVLAAKPTPRIANIERQTPRISITVKRLALAKKSLGRKELKGFKIWGDGRPETELNFKFYRQATNKVVGLTTEAVRFLEGYF
jgi:hypothetical protein